MSEVLKDFSANIDLKETLVFEPIKVVEGDNGNVLVLNIVKDGDPVDLTDCLVQIVFAHSGRTVWQDSSSPDGGITISGDDHNIVTVRLHSDSYAPNGITVCQVKVYSGPTQTTLVSSSRFSFKAELSLLNAETVESIEQYSILVTLIESVNSVLDRDQADWDETDNLKVSYIRNKPVAGTDYQSATQVLTAETTLSDTDTVPFYDASATAHRKSTWSNIVAKIRTALFGSVTGLLKLDGAGNASAGLANTDFAAAIHASRHASGAADAVTPSAIGAASLDANSKVTASEASAKIFTYTDSHTLLLENAGALVEMNKSTACNLTVPPNSSVAFPVGTEIEIKQLGAGQVTIVAGSGVTLRNADTALKIEKQYCSASLKKRATDEWYVDGRTVA